MITLKPWQLIGLALPIFAIALFILIAAGFQIHAWGLSWVWAVITLVVVGWLLILAQWTKRAIAEREIIPGNWQTFAKTVSSTTPEDTDQLQRVEAILAQVIQSTRNDPPIWEDLQTFWQRCQTLVSEIAQVYHPSVKYPLLNIYVPQAYGLIRGTVDDMDQWMHQISPVLNKVSVGQAVAAYETSSQYAPWLQRALQVWGWSLWVRNPAAALARHASKDLNEQATQQLLVNLGQLARESALQHLTQRAVELYGQGSLPWTPTAPNATLTSTRTQTLQGILEQAESQDEIQTKPVEIVLVGRTGAGKSSLINTLFQAQLATVDILPSTQECQKFTWQEDVVLWDVPGYEQTKRPDLRQSVLGLMDTADVVLLVTPALDPALQMDLEFLEAIHNQRATLPMLIVVTQVDQLRPKREWAPPYDWHFGNRPKEIAIRDATRYRAEALQDVCDRILPVVTADPTVGRPGWNLDALSTLLLDYLQPARQARLARWMTNLEAQAMTATQLIDRIATQLSTAQGIINILKSPSLLAVLQTYIKGIPALAPLLAEAMPVEQAPLIGSKLWLTWELYTLFHPAAKPQNVNWLALRPLLTHTNGTPQDNIWAFGQVLVEYWSQDLPSEALQQRFDVYLQQR